jgi:hypothetical protein
MDYPRRQCPAVYDGGACFGMDGENEIEVRSFFILPDNVVCFLEKRNFENELSKKQITWFVS